MHHDARAGASRGEHGAIASAVEQEASERSGEDGRGRRCDHDGWTSARQSAEISTVPTRESAGDVMEGPGETAWSRREGVGRKGRKGRGERGLQVEPLAGRDLDGLEIALGEEKVDDLQHHRLSQDQTACVMAAYPPSDGLAKA
eukprot:876777-Rhodomonas_salina.1